MMEIVALCLLLLVASPIAVFHIGINGELFWQQQVCECWICSAVTHGHIVGDMSNDEFRRWWIVMVDNHRHELELIRYG